MANFSNHVHAFETIDFAAIVSHCFDFVVESSLTKYFSAHILEDAEAPLGFVKDERLFS
ncbi:MAG: hypothetical protein ACOX5I_00095 [Gleimia sp.]|nr:hypothetical protein [Acidobacteriota bacterium]